MKEAAAHLGGPSGQPHPLLAHLEEVARLAGRFVAEAGMWGEVEKSSLGGPQNSTRCSKHPESHRVSIRTSPSIRQSWADSMGSRRAEPPQDYLPL